MNGFFGFLRRFWRSNNMFLWFLGIFKEFSSVAAMWKTFRRLFWGCHEDLGVCNKPHERIQRSLKRLVPD